MGGWIYVLLPLQDRRITWKREAEYYTNLVPDVCETFDTLDNNYRYDQTLFWVSCTHLSSIQRKFSRPWLLPVFANIRPPYSTLEEKRLIQKSLKIPHFWISFENAKKNIGRYFRLSLIYFVK